MAEAQLLTGNALDLLPTLPEASVRCCVTSPPYWGLRDYGTATWEGGDSGCDHRGAPQQSQRSTLLGNGHGGGKQLSPSLQSQAVPYRNVCGKCGAVRVDAQLGLERTPEEYVARMVAVFREVRRVLTDDGTLWLNLGDSYAGGGTIGRNDTTPESLARRAASYGTGTGKGSAVGKQGTRDAVAGLKPKDLVGIPWRVAFALQADGWYLRSDIIWAKPNPMPESVTDRPTKSHEYLFLLAKSERYYYDAAAVAEPGVDPERQRFDRIGGANGHTVRHSAGGMVGATVTRNARSVWTIATQPYPEAHFATFPEELARRCIVAGSAPGDTVLDPFSGSGTVAAVAVGNGRKAIGIELNPAYQAMAERRVGPMFVVGRAAS